MGGGLGKNRTYDTVEPQVSREGIFDPERLTVVCSLGTAVSFGILVTRDGRQANRVE